MAPIAGSTQPFRADGHERGTAILINMRTHFEKLTLNSQLQAAADEIWLGKWYTICSLYLPNVPASRQDVENLLSQLRPPFLLLGDMNAKSPLWGEATTNDRGAIFETILLNNNVTLLNTNASTLYHVQTVTYSTIDLSICSSDCILDFNYEVIDSLHDSDHFPIKITTTVPRTNLDRPPRFKTERANWELFQTMTETCLNADEVDDIDELVDNIGSIIMESAEVCIPTSSGTVGRVSVLWWTADCRNAIKERRRAERALKRARTVGNEIAYNRTKAKCRHVFNSARKESWRRFVSSINRRVSQQKIWKKDKKVSGKFIATPPSLLRIQTEPSFTSLWMWFIAPRNR